MPESLDLAWQKTVFGGSQDKGGDPDVGAGNTDIVNQKKGCEMSIAHGQFGRRKIGRAHV